MAQEQKVNKAKVNKKINFYKFVGKVEGSSGISKKTQVLNIGTTNVLNSVNNLGKAVNKLAEMLLDLKGLMVKNFLDQSKISSKKKSTTPSTIKKKPEYKSGGGTMEAIAGAAGGLFSGILGILKNLFEFFVVTSVLKWLSDPANKEKLTNIVKGVGAFLKFLMDITSGVVNTTLNAIAALTKLPFWKEILQFGLFMAALGTSFLALRKIFGGKAVGFVLKGIVSVFGNFFSALTKFSVGLAKRLGPKGLLLAGGAAAAAVGVGYLANQVTGQNEAAPVQAQQQAEVNRGEALAVQGTDTMADQTPSVGNLGPAPATGSLPPAASGGPIALPKMPSLSSGGKIASQKPSVPKKSDGGKLVMPKKRASGGTVVPTNNIGKFKPPMMKGPKPSPRGNIKPLSGLSKYLKNGKKGFGKGLTKLMMLPIKVIGLAVAGIISRLFKMISKIPGAGLLAGIMSSLIVPIAAMFGIPKSVFGRVSSAIRKNIGLKPGDDAKQKQEETKQRLAEKEAESQAAAESGSITKAEIVKKGGPKKNPLYGRKLSPFAGIRNFFGGLFGANKKKAGGGWISGPQTGYPVSLDGGKSVAFIGHGTEYVATKAGGGSTGSAFVIPFDTPSTRGNANLTDRRITEATNSGFSLPMFDGGGEYTPDGKPKDARRKQRLKRDDPNRKKFASGGLLSKLGDGTKLATAPVGYCTTGVLETMAANNVPNPPGTGSDGNNPRGLMVQMIKNYGWGSMPFGKAINLNSPYGKVGANMMNYEEWTKNVKAGNIPSGALVFSTRNANWNSDGPSSGHDSAIAKKGGQKLWSGHWQAVVNGVGSVYGAGTRAIVALTPGGQAVKYDPSRAGPDAGPTDPNSPARGPAEQPAAQQTPEQIMSGLISALESARGSLYGEKPAAAQDGTAQPAAKPAAQPQSPAPATPTKAFGGALGKVELSDIVFPKMYLKGGAKHPMQIWAEKFTNLAKKVKDGQSGSDVISQVNIRNAGAEYGKAAFGGKKPEESAKAQAKAASEPKPGDLTPMEQWAKANRNMIEKVGTKKQKEILAQLDAKEAALKNAAITKKDQSAFASKEAMATADMFKNAKFGTVPFETPGLAPAPSSSNQSAQSQLKTESEKSQKAEETAKQTAKANVANNAAKIVQAASQQSAAAASQQSPPRGAAGTSAISIPIPSGGGSKMDDVILYRPGFGLFAGAVRGGF